MKDPWEDINKAATAIVVDDRVDIFRQWADADREVERLRNVIRDSEKNFKEVAAKREQLARKIRGYIDPDSEQCSPTNGDDW